MSQINQPATVEKVLNQLESVERELEISQKELEIAHRRIGLASHMILALVTSQDTQTGLWAKGQFDGADPAKPFESIQNALSIVAKALCVK